ncbi:PadR family transcriptional regulator [Nocardiopsis sp. MG754419]|uniref:PadR family transcriptional regulator n=1 Tax=Nocardiopsis sp. MG754419 TaxID=2259865 RepID=UPI001BAD81AA|nr:PadR family transcriptional regulator [Nocardiopsis sp. MG754419]MBR8741415.1 PadR family transcriptional regulator [Nocardiopsis sp. MG754419]
MSLPHAILTALLEKPSSGLELTRRFDRSIGYFWSATHQQIYRELGKLEKNAFIRALPTDSPTRGRRKEYEVLPAGRAELERWVGENEQPRALRDTLMLRLRATGVVGVDADFLAELRRHRALHGARLAEYREFQRRDTARGRGTERDRVQALVLQGGVDMELFWVNWLDQAIAELADTPEDAPGPEDDRDRA